MHLKESLAPLQVHVSEENIADVQAEYEGPGKTYGSTT